jgi:hypothetical protein
VLSRSEEVLPHDGRMDLAILSEKNLQNASQQYMSKQRKYQYSQQFIQSQHKSTGKVEV